jgi:hypothetical protein
MVEESNAAARNLLREAETMQSHFARFRQLQQEKLRGHHAAPQRYAA